MTGRIIFIMTTKKVLIHGDLTTKSVAQYCYPDLYVPSLHKDNHVKDSFTDGLGQLSTTFEDIAWIL
jgi:hypothetical protein